MVEMMARAGTPSFFSRDTWSFINAISGDTTKHRPPMASAGTWKQRLLPPPVGSSASVSLPASAARMISSCRGRKRW